MADLPPPILRKKLFNLFDPSQPVKLEDSYYVDLNKVRGTDKLLKQLEDNIILAETSTHQLVSGLPGCGKTTELIRLRKSLGNQNYFVVYCDANEYLDLADVEYSDILLAIVQAVWSEAKQVDPNFSLNSAYQFPAFTSFISSFKTELNISGFKDKDPDNKRTNVDDIMAMLKFEVSKNLDNRSLVRLYLRRKSNNFLEAINEIINQVKLSVTHIGFSDLVIIFDNLEKIIPSQTAHTERTNYETIFIDSANNLISINCHVIYTIPLDLVISSQGLKLSDLYNTFPVKIPTVPVTTRTGLFFLEGEALMKKIIEARLKEASLSVEQVFESVELVDMLCKFSGGHIRELLSFIRTAITYNRFLPITIETVEYVIRDRRDSYLRSILSKKYWDILRKVAKTKKPSQEKEYLELLPSLAIPIYYDESGYWCDVYPVIREAKEFYT